MANSEVTRRALIAATGSYVALAALWPQQVLAAGPSVETSNGKIRGLIVRGVHVFKGVRYGDTTGGANRFMPPMHPPKWGGVADATRWGNSAPQQPETQTPFYSWYTHIQPTSEDCLFANIFTPGLRDGGKRPVMVWLHGGSWESCAGSAPGFDGTNLAHSQDVVVVTLNHRLNAFGYLQLDHRDERFADSGNAGMLDLVLALEWVKTNIAQFGGDPANVTIFGQSGGAAKVLALMGFPAAEGLFHKAIVQSCSGGMKVDGQDEAGKQTALLCKLLGIDEATGGALQKVPVDRMVAALKGVGDPFRPVVDGRNFIRDPFFPTAPDNAANVPLMIGNTNTESTYYLQVDPRNFSLTSDDVSRRLNRFLRADPQLVEHIIDTYRCAYPSYDPSRILTSITTDYLFKRNTLKVAGLQATSSRKPVFAYVFARETPIQNGRIQAPHTSEIPFIFGTADIAEAMIGTGADIAPMRRVMMKTWASFARTGNPNNKTLPKWLPFDEERSATMVLLPESRLAYSPGGDARKSLDGLPYYEYSMSRSAFVKG